jgi:phospholipid/cholesterol/gamma-HCH transport system substrate-binding protein
MSDLHGLLHRSVRAVVLVLAAALVLSGCSFDVYKLPLPGGADVGSNPITITADFRDVLDLVPDSTVKVNDVTVGKITDVSLQGYHAVVTMQLRNTTKLPDNAVASIQQTSLLGEKFVELAAPGDPSPDPLSTGDVIPIAHTGANPEVEEVLGALSLLLNGGGVGQLQTITRELNKTLHGREGDARSVLHQIRQFSGQLDRHKQDIVHALDALDRLSTSLNHQRGTIDATLDELPSALHSIDTQRHDLVRMLKALAHLSGVGTRVINLSKDATIDTLRSLDPVLGQLQASGSDFVNAFQVALTYPFVDQVVGRDPQVARNLQMGDYTNLDIKFDLSLDQDGSLPIPTGLPTKLPTLPTQLPTSLPTSEVTKILGDVAKCLQSGDITSKACRAVLGDPQELLRLIAQCKKKKNDDNAVCQVLDALPSIPTGGPSLSLPTSILTSILGGVLRPGTPALRRTSFGPHGPTMRQLSRLYDPALVDLLVPGMVMSR